jgi:CheY-like chemotaxis protein
MSKQKLILIVDDDIYHTTYYKHILELEGFSVAQRRSLKEAKRFIAENNPDFIVVDVMMDDDEGETGGGFETKGGFETGAVLAKWIKQNHPEVPFVGLSNYLSAEVATIFRTLGQGYYHKNEWAPRDFAARIKSMIENPRSAEGVSLFYSYAHDDERFRNKMESHLSNLKRERVISQWNDRKITPGTEWKREIDKHLEAAQVIVLLVSAGFIHSEFCYSVELRRALERHESGTARVIPIIVRPCDWHSAPFGMLQALPRDGKAITTWRNRDEAFLEVAMGIRKVIGQMNVQA